MEALRICVGVLVVLLVLLWLRIGYAVLEWWKRRTASTEDLEKELYKATQSLERLRGVAARLKKEEAPAADDEQMLWIVNYQIELALKEKRLVWKELDRRGVWWQHLEGKTRMVAQRRGGAENSSTKMPRGSTAFTGKEAVK